MRKSIKKAIAFTLAMATVVAAIGVSQPTKAAEYGDVKEVLPMEYERYAMVGDNAFFASCVKENETNYLDEIVIVDKNGEKINVDVKTSDGKYKYTRVSSISEDYVAVIKTDGSYDLFMEDGTWYANRELAYDEIFPLRTGDFAVKDGESIHITDSKGKIIIKDAFKMGEDGYVWGNIVMGDYMAITAEDWSGKYGTQSKFFDKDYKEVTKVDLEGYHINDFEDKFIVVYNESEAYLYDSSLKKLDFSYMTAIPENPSVSADQMVLVESRISYAWFDYDNNSKSDILCLGIDNYYADALENTNSVYEYVYVDLNTLKILPTESVDRYSYSEYDITNTDLSYQESKDGEKYLLDGKVIVDDKIAEAFVKNNIQGFSYFRFSYAVGSGGDFYLELALADEEYNIKYKTLMLEKATGYDINKAKVIDKEIISYTYTCGGCIWFADSTSIVNGKELGKEITLHMTYSDAHYGSANYYVTSKEKDGKEIYTLYDKNHEEVLSRNDKIEDMVAGVNVVVSKSVEVEGSDYPVKKYGCISFAKTLVSNEDVLEELEYAEEGDTVEVEVNKDAPIKAEIFETIKGKDIDVVVKLENGMSWNINGKNIDGEKLTDINLTVEVVEDVVPVAAIEKIELKGEKIELSLAHTGKFGFTAQLKMNVKAENVGKYANRFYYNPETKALEFQEAVKIDENGDVIFTYTHASDYVIILSEAAYEVPKDNDTTDAVKPDDAKPDEPTSTVKPGDMTNIGMLVVMLGVAAAMFVFQKKKVHI